MNYIHIIRRSSLKYFQLNVNLVNFHINIYRDTFKCHSQYTLLILCGFATEFINLQSVVQTNTYFIRWAARLYLWEQMYQMAIKYTAIHLNMAHILLILPTVRCKLPWTACEHNRYDKKHKLISQSGMIRKFYIIVCGYSYICVTDFVIIP